MGTGHHENTVMSEACKGQPLCCNWEESMGECLAGASEGITSCWARLWLPSAAPWSPAPLTRGLRPTTWSSVFWKQPGQPQGDHGWGENGLSHWEAIRASIELEKRWWWEWHFLSFLSNTITTTRAHYLLKFYVESLENTLAATSQWNLKGKHVLTSIE